MSVRVIPTEVFTRAFKILKKKYRSLESDLLELEEVLKNDPFAGDDLGKGLRKVRMAIKSKNKGKSGGARVITYQDIIFSSEGTNIFLLTIYDKSSREDVSTNELKALLKSAGLT